jgi:hypothetical protein
MTSTQRPGGSFVIRIWHDEADAGEARPRWRGWVQHTRSGESVYVQDLKDMFDFIERWTGPLDTADEQTAHLK